LSAEAVDVLNDPVAHLLVGGGDRAFAQVGLEHVRAGEVRATQTRAAKIGAPQGRLAEGRALHVGAEQHGVVELSAVEVHAGHDRAREVRVGQIAAGQAQARNIGESEVGAGPALLGRPQPFMPGADDIHLRLSQAFRGDAGGWQGGHREVAGNLLYKLG